MKIYPYILMNFYILRFCKFNITFILEIKIVEIFQDTRIFSCKREIKGMVYNFLFYQSIIEINVIKGK